MGPDIGGSTRFVRSNGGHGSEMIETVVDYMFRNLFPYQICNIKSPIITNVNHFEVEIAPLSNALNTDLIDLLLSSPKIMNLEIFW